MGFISGMQGLFNTQNLIDVTRHSNRLKKKGHMIMSVSTEKAFDKIQYVFRIKCLRELGLEGTEHLFLKT